MAKSRFIVISTKDDRRFQSHPRSPSQALDRPPRLGQRVTVSTDGGMQPLWSRDGRELFYRGPLGWRRVGPIVDFTLTGVVQCLLSSDPFEFVSQPVLTGAPFYGSQTLGGAPLLLAAGVEEFKSGVGAGVFLEERYDLP